MKRFVFRLQTVLEHRESIEQRLLGELAALRRAEHLEKVKLEELKAAHENACNELSELACSGANPWELSNADDHCQALSDDIKVQQLSVEAAHRANEAKLVEVVDAARNRKILEQLRDKQKLEYETAAAKLDQSEIEEIHIGEVLARCVLKDVTGELFSNLQAAQARVRAIQSKLNRLSSESQSGPINNTNRFTNNQASVQPVLSEGAGAGAAIVEGIRVRAAGHAIRRYYRRRGQ